jgi:hypothetical protein
MDKHDCPQIVRDSPDLLVPLVAAIASRSYDVVHELRSYWDLSSVGGVQYDWRYFFLTTRCTRNAGVHCSSDRQLLEVTTDR